jgi:ligand-binding SRPBCC domain-containing protein
MRLSISTIVDLDYLSVKQQFDASLLKKLSPPFPKVSILRFDGIRAPDQVVMELDFLFFKQRWEGKIVEDFLDENEFRFVDVGVKLPFFLKEWQHTHRLINQGNRTLIKDEIQYKSGNKIFTVLLYPVMVLQFLYRKPIYKRLLSRKRKLA